MASISPQQAAQVRARARCLHTEQEVEEALDALAQALTARVAGANPILLCVMNGGLITTGKLATRLDFTLQLDYVHATRYRNQTHGADLEWQRYPALALAGRTVVVIDDIFDEGATLASIADYCRQQGAAQVYTLVLVDKQHARKQVTMRPDFVGLVVEDFYLFGYGMDYKGYLRNAAGIYAVDPADV